MLARNINVIESVEVSLVTETKQSKEVIEIFLKDETNLQSLKKLKSKQVKKSYEKEIIKIEGENSYKRYVHTKHKCLVYYSG